MPRKKQIVQKRKRQKTYREEGIVSAQDIKPKGFFKFFGNYPLFALIGAVTMIGGLLISAVYTGSGAGRLGSDGSTRGQGVIRSTPEAGATTASGAAPRVKTYPAPPALSIDPNKKYTATIKTDKGDVKLELLASEAPQTVNNFVFLAKDGFYNGVTFHRVVADFIAQTGDPTGTGSGGPGYDLPVEKNDEALTEGTVAMAKPNQAGAPNNGSQFFITLSDQPTLAGSTTVFGRVIEGMDVIRQLTQRVPEESSGDLEPGDRIETITIEEA